MTTQRPEDPATGPPEDETWFDRPAPPEAPEDAPQPLPPAPGATRAERRRAREASEAAAGRPFAEAFTESPSGTGWTRPTLPPRTAGPAAPSAGGSSAGGSSAGGSSAAPYSVASYSTGAASDARRSGAVPAAREQPRAQHTNAGAGPGGGGDLVVGRRGPGFGRGSEGVMAGEGVPGAFDPGDTGTWRVRDVVPGVDGGRRTTTILRYLLGLLAIDHVRALTRWAFALPVLGLFLLLVRPRWIGLAVIALGVLLVLGRVVAVRLISRRTLPRRYRPVEDQLRAAVEAGKANLRGELRRVGLPSSPLALPGSLVRLGSSDTRRTARSQLRDIEIDRVLPRAQLERALRVLDDAPAPR